VSWSSFFFSFSFHIIHQPNSAYLCDHWLRLCMKESHTSFAVVKIILGSDCHLFFFPFPPASPPLFFRQHPFLSSSSIKLSALLNSWTVKVLWLGRSSVLFYTHQVGKSLLIFFPPSKIWWSSFSVQLPNPPTIIPSPPPPKHLYSQMRPDLTFTPPNFSSSWTPLLVVDTNHVSFL